MGLCSLFVVLGSVENYPKYQEGSPFYSWLLGILACFLFRSLSFRVQRLVYGLGSSVKDELRFRKLAFGVPNTYIYLLNRLQF